MNTRSLLILLLVAVIGISGYLVFGWEKSTNVQESAVLGNANASAGSDEKFAYLVRQTSSSCGLQRQTVLGYPDEQRIQGSCCNKMDLTAYQKQVEGLKKYKDFSFIPKDSYDTSAKEAKVAYGFLDSIILTAGEQKIYNDAMKISHEGGPCCCKCWHWDVYEGIAKKMIADYGWNAEQIAELWDLSEGCGGPLEHG